MGEVLIGKSRFFWFSCFGGGCGFARALPKDSTHQRGDKEGLE